MRRTRTVRGPPLGRTANRPGSQRVVWPEDAGLIRSASACPRAADGNRPQSATRTANAPRPQRREHGRAAWNLSTNLSPCRAAADGDRPRSASGSDREPSRFAARCLARRRGAYPERFGLPTRCGRGPSAVRPVSDRERSVVPLSHGPVVPFRLSPSKSAPGTVKYPLRCNPQRRPGAFRRHRPPGWISSSWG